MSGYDPEKVLLAFKNFNCSVYVSKNRIKVDFPEDINQLHEMELRLAFKKANNKLHEYLMKQLGARFKRRDAEELIRVI